MFRSFPLMVLLVPLIWALGVIGFEQLRPDGDLMDSAYRALQLFGLAFEADPAWLEARDGQVPPLLLIARALAGLSLVGTALTLLSSRFRQFVQLWAQILVRRRPRAILLGLGQVNSAIARELLAQGYVVTAVDSRNAPAARRKGLAQSMLTLEGDLLDRDVLAKTRPDRADLVIAACGHDELTLEVAGTIAALRRERLVDKSSPGHVPREDRSDEALDPVHAHVNDQRLLADLGDARDLGFDRHLDIRAFSLKAGAALDVLAHARLVETARELKQTRVHALICGLGNQGMALLIELVQNCHGAGLAAPRITVIDRDATRIRKALSAHLPGLTDGRLPEEARPTLSFLEQDMEALDFEAESQLTALFDDKAAPTAVFLCCGEDTLNLGLSMRLETAMRRRVLPPRAIYTRLWDGGDPGSTGYRLSPLNLTRRFGMSSQTARNELRRRDQIEARAQVLHFSYRDALDGLSAEDRESRSAYDRAWRDLPDMARRSNRRAARHLPSKLVELGLQWRHMMRSDLPRLSPEVAQTLGDAFRALETGHAERDDDIPDAAHALVPLLKQAARTEHARWLVNQALEGARLGPLEATEDTPGKVRLHHRRDPGRQWHNMFKSFDDLDATEQSFDLTALKTCLDPLPGMPLHPEAHWRKPLVVDARRLPLVAKAPAPADWDTSAQLAEITELDLTLPFSHQPFADGLADRVLDTVRAWSRHQKACRLVLRLDRPEFEPRHEVVRPPVTDLAKRLRDLLPEGVALDVHLPSDPVSGSKPLSGHQV